jgi:hypothetical protein
MWLVKAVKDLQAKVAAPVPVALSNADRDAIIAALTVELGPKLDQLLARLAAAGDALDG